MSVLPILVIMEITCLGYITICLPFMSKVGYRLLIKKGSTFRKKLDELMAAELRGHHPIRDKVLLLLIFRHGLRVSEAISLRWDAVMLELKVIGITRLKKSNSGTHPLQPDEIEALADLREENYLGPYLFVSERG